MKLRLCLISLMYAGAAFAFGVVANAAIDLVTARVAVKAVAPVPAEAAAPPARYALASVTSSPAEISPVKVKTVTIQYETRAPEPVAAEPVAAPVPVSMAVPLPRPRPAFADSTASISRQPASMAISAATRKAAPDDGDPLGTAGIERMKTALALTAEQEEYWPAIAAELRTIGRTLSQKVNAKGHTGKIAVDNDAVQRLYWAAAPLLTRLTPEQKLKAKQMAHLMGLQQVAEAL